MAPCGCTMFGCCRITANSSFTATRTQCYHPASCMLRQGSPNLFKLTVDQQHGSPESLPGYQNPPPSSGNSKSWGLHDASPRPKIALNPQPNLLPIPQHQAACFADLSYKRASLKANSQLCFLFCLHCILGIGLDSWYCCALYLVRAAPAS